MRTYLDCYPCILRQALGASRCAGANPEQQISVIQNVLTLLQEILPEQTPPEIAHQVHRIVADTISASDLYREAKRKSTEDALALYPDLKKLVEQSADPLDTAIRISIAGNIIDFGAYDHIEDLHSVVDRVILQPYDINDTKNFRKKLSCANQVLFLADNAGETVFDRILIETLELPVIYAVKGGPILNDALMEDAVAAGVHQCATLISNGSDAPGTILPLCSNEFCQIYDEMSLVIAKGQANYETLSEAGEKVFCLLLVKCPVIANDIGAPVGSIVVCQSRKPVSHQALI